VRTGLAVAIRILLDADDPAGAILATSRLLEGESGFLALLATKTGVVVSEVTLNGQIEKLRLAGVLPSEIADDLHWIRLRANGARHNNSRARITTEDAATAISRALRVVEWFYTECSLYAERTATIFERQQALSLSERFQQLQEATELQTKSLRAGLDRLRQEARQEHERASVLDTRRIPIPLPSLRGTFVNRNLEQAALKHALAASEKKVIIVVGPAGYGKTELVTCVLKSVVPSSEITSAGIEGILYIRCARGDVNLERIFLHAGHIVGRAQQFADVFAASLDLDRKLEYLFSELSRGGDVWVVLDNCEDILDRDDTIADPVLRRFFEVATTTEHRVKLLITSRAVPRLGKNAAVTLVPLDIGLPEDAAVEYMRAEGAVVGLDTENRSVLLRAVQRVHSVPKALDMLIGHLIERYPVTTLAQLVTDPILFADYERRDAVDGLRHLIAQQFEAQTFDAKLALCALSIFNGPVTVDAIRYVLPALDWSLVLPRIVRNRLVTFSGGLYDLHPLVRSVVYDTLPALPDLTVHNQFTRDALHLRAAAFFREIRTPSDQWRSLLDLRPHLDEFYHLVRARQYADSARLLDLIDDDYLCKWGHYGLTLELRGELPVTDIGDAQRQRMHYLTVGECHEHLGNLKDGLEAYMASWSVACEAQSPSGQRRAAIAIAGVLRQLGEISEALEWLDRALVLARENREGIGEAAALMAKASTLETAGLHHEAVAVQRLSVQRVEELGYGEQYPNYVGQLALLLSYVGEREEARKYLDKALAVARHQQYRVTEGICLSVLASIEAEHGSQAEAISLYERALMSARETRYAYGVQARLQRLGCIYHLRGELDQAQAYYQDACSWGALGNNLPDLYLGTLLAERQDPAALGFIERSVTHVDHLLSRDERNWEAWFARAFAAAVLGHEARALSMYGDGLRRFSASGVRSGLRYELPLLGRIAGREGVAAALKALLSGAS
jgi:tetratricopeptide (TPR) repeat protein